jgi:glycosyltransferase involved in cell wall biosynthesis
VLLSVVIPAFDAADFVGEAVESAVAQGDVVGEIVIVNDASTDGTRRVCRRLARRHARIRYAEHAENRGGGATRNSCVRLATGDYLFNLDADNVLTEGLLARLLARAQQHAAEEGGHAVVAPARLQFFRDIPRRFGLGRGRRILERAWDFDRLDSEHLLTHPNTPPSSGNYLFHRSIFEAVGGYAEAHGPYDTWSFGLRCCLAGFPFATAPGTSYLHRVTGVSYWQRNQDSGANRGYLFRAVRDLGCYDLASVRELDPASGDYPADPLACLRLASAAGPQAHL